MTDTKAPDLPPAVFRNSFEFSTPQTVDQPSFDDGESSMEADFQIALDVVVPFSWSGPVDLANKLAAYLKTYGRQST